MIGSPETQRKGESSGAPLTTNYRSIARSFFLRVCVAVTLALILVVGVELFTYWRGVENQHTMGPEVDAAVVEGTPEEREYWKEQQPAQRVQYEPYVLWRRAPFNGSAISIDADGIRRTLHNHCDAKTFTVWMFGDSVMWGWGSPDSETIPSLVAADYEKAGKQVCIVNYGEKGWANTQELFELIQELKHADRKPDAVLFYDGGTEAFTAYENKKVDVHSNYLDFKNYLEGWITEKKSGFSYLSRSNTYHLLENIAAKVSAKVAPKRDKSDTVNESEAETWSRAIMQNYRENMDIIDLLAKQYGFRPIFAWYPNMDVGHKQLTPDEAVLDRRLKKKFPGMDLVYRAAYERCREVSRPDLYYLGDLLDDTKAPLYRGIAHLNATGNQMAADRLFQILENPPNQTIAKNSAKKISSAHLSESKANQTAP
ncbi:MAG: SGNH/GDSL hydrolase family protein [Terriglobales bacterium]